MNGRTAKALRYHAWETSGKEGPPAVRRKYRVFKRAWRKGSGRWGTPEFRRALIRGYEQWHAYFCETIRRGRVGRTDHCEHHGTRRKIILGADVIDCPECVHERAQSPS